MTKRAVSEAMELLIDEEFKILDHGFVIVRDYMGNDESIEKAARISYSGGGTRTSRDTQNLINYLMEHRHTTPFEMCEVKFHLKMPIFVARQWIRHRTASINEISARYSILDKEFYIPEHENILPQAKDNKQGRAASVLPYGVTDLVRKLLIEDSRKCYEHYMTLMGEESMPQSQSAVLLNEDGNFEGIARELARMNLTLNTYTQFIWKVDLHNLLHFLKLRTDPHAQYEIRVYANQIWDIVKQWVPMTSKAFLKLRLDAIEFSGEEKGFLGRLLLGDELKKPESWSERKFGEFLKKLENVRQSGKDL